MKKFLFSCVCAMATAGTANATIVTFDNVYGPDDTGSLFGIYTENGVTVTSHTGQAISVVGATNGALHIGDRDARHGSAGTFTMGRRFDAIGFQLSGNSGSPYCENPISLDPENCGYAPDYGNIRVTGSRDGEIVAESIFHAPETPTAFTLGEDFRDLYSLTFTAFLPDPPNGLELAPFCFDPCFHADVDNVELVSNVPLPGTLALLLSGIAAILRYGYVLPKDRQREILAAH